jgi:hypothetical protein
MPPSPMGETISYGPSLIPVGSVMWVSFAGIVLSGG